MKDKLEQIAREMYGIINFIDVKGQKKKKSIKKKKINFKKILEIINNLIESNKRKYKIIISQNEKEIFKLEQKKLQLLKKLKNEEISNNDADKEIKEFLGNEILINNENKDKDKEKEKDNGNINNIKNDDGIIYGKLVVKNGEDEINKNKNINSGINYQEKENKNEINYKENSEKKNEESGMTKKKDDEENINLKNKKVINNQEDIIQEKDNFNQNEDNEYIINNNIIYILFNINILK